MFQFMQNHTIQRLLQAQFQLRLSTNEHYSMRAFAKDLKLSPSQLSLVLSGKRGLSRARAQIIADELNLPPIEKEIFLNQVEVSYARSESARELAKTNLAELSAHDQSVMSRELAFHVFSEWHHFAILQAMRLKSYVGFCELEGEAQFLSRVLNLETNEVISALDRLSQLSLIKKHANGICFEAIPGVVLSQEGVQASAFKKFKKQLTQKAFRAMDFQDRDQNGFEGILLNVNAVDFQAIKEEVKAFSERLKDKYQNNNNEGAHVIALTQQVYELTRISGIDS